MDSDTVHLALQIAQTVVIPAMIWLGKWLRDLVKSLEDINHDLTDIRERIAHIEGAIGVKLEK